MRLYWNFWKRSPNDQQAQSAIFVSREERDRRDRRDVEGLDSASSRPSRTAILISSILFRIDDMESRRMTGREQLCIGTDDGQPQGLELQSERQLQNL